MDLEENKNHKRNIKEFNVPVYWGHIAVKAWGNEDDPHVLVFHGRSDNAGSFDNLIPLLPVNFYYICADWPGHGLSSPFPPHLMLQTIDFIIPLKILVDYFKKEKYILLGHSYGAQLSSLFSELYPNYVEKVIMLDVIAIHTIESKQAISYIRRKVDKTFDIQEKSISSKPPAYTYEEALEKLSNNRYNGEKLRRKAAEPLLKRSLKQNSDGTYSFTTDQRMKAYMNPLHDSRYRIEAYRHCPIAVPILMIFAKLNDLPRKRYGSILSHLQTNKNVNVVYVDGAHDVHNNYPERVATYINKFLLAQKAKI